MVANRRRQVVLGVLILVVGLVVAIQPVLAAATAQGVALSAWANCGDADLDITLTTVGATREYGLITNEAGDVLGEFEEPTGLSNFSGTYGGYGMLVSPTQPEGTVIGSYAYVGETPPSAADTAEFFVLYECSSGTSNVLDTCYGPYGMCPQTAQQALAITAPGCDALLNIPSTAVGGTFVTDAPVYWAPGELTSPLVTIPAGNSARVIGLDSTGEYYKIIWVCNYVWVPRATLGPNYDAVWNGAPLPTAVVN
ncbi:MAG: hypothetical protein KJ047_08590 [Anaerolineae bacterium]|nr:hypothetical protein [Anaerolineae bacterium]